MGDYMKSSQSQLSSPLKGGQQMFIVSSGEGTLNVEPKTSDMQGKNLDLKLYLQTLLK